jgi:hypothetical protein
VDNVDELGIAVSAAQRYCRAAVSTVMWPTICEIVKAAPGFICPNCIASSVALPGVVVIMATLGLSRVDGFETVQGGMRPLRNARASHPDAAESHRRPLSVAYSIG